MSSDGTIIMIAFRLIACVVPVFVIVCVGKCIYTSYGQELLGKRSVQTDIFAEVTDKDSRTVLVGKVVVRKYEATIDVGGTTQKVNITEDIYENVNIGDKMEVTVYTLKDKIVDVECKSVNLQGKK